MRYSTSGKQNLETSSLISCTSCYLQKYIVCPPCLTRRHCSLLPIQRRISQLYVDNVVIKPRLRGAWEITVFECPVGSLIFCVGHRFYSTMTARLLAERKALAVYSIAYDFSEGSPPSGPFFLPSLSRKWRGSGPVPGKAVYYSCRACQIR
jgi:hypothetical protein